MANLFSWMGSAVSDRLSAEKDLRHECKHQLKTAGLSRSYGSGKQIWESCYKANKGASLGTLSAAVGQIPAAIQAAKAPTPAPPAPTPTPVEPTVAETTEMLKQLNTMLSSSNLSPATKKVLNKRIQGAMSS